MEANITLEEDEILIHNNFSNHTSTLLFMEEHEEPGMFGSKGNLNQLFLMLMGVLILFMQAGFGFLEAGSVRSKNVTNILIKNFVDLTFGVLSYVLVGYALAYGEGSSVIGLKGFGLSGVPFSDYTYVFFQATFAATCATIVSGSMAERCNFNGYIIFSILLTGLFYPIHSHWCWNKEGWLVQTDFHDFAGSGVVHLAGGTVAFVGAYMLGPRLGRFTQTTEGPALTGHSVPLISLGAFILIFGFMAFNGGSQASIENPGDGEIIGRAVINTLVAACIGGNTVLFIKKFGPGGGTWSLIQMINGTLVGMVSICAGTDAFYPWSSAVIAAIAGVGYILTSNFMVYLKIDDPLDAVAVHGNGGLLGLILAPIFMDIGIVYGEERGWSILAWNCAGACVIIAYNAVAGVAIFSLLKMLDLLRVTEEQETTGLDWIKHKEPAYPIEGHIDDLKNLPGYLSYTTPSYKTKVVPVIEAEGDSSPTRRKSINGQHAWTMTEKKDENSNNNIIKGDTSYHI